MKALVLGGVKSGKSRHAETLAETLSDQVTVIVTAQALDDEMAARIKRHQSDRSSAWHTIEAPVKLGAALRSIQQCEVVIIDCLTLWLTNLLMLPDKKEAEQEIADFELAVKNSNNPLIMVSNETNMGLVPLGEISRKYCDQAGMLHQRLAKLCDRVELIVAGLPLVLKQ
jgi:adenosylcobinamide kinase / adenosylcobinamide-phosphate guanylyltransferase